MPTPPSKTAGSIGTRICSDTGDALRAFNVYPKEIESEIDAIEGVVETAVIGLPHADFGEGVTAVVVPQKGAKLDEAAILQALDGRLAKFKMPKRVLFEDDLPRNTMGKVQKNVLRDKYKPLYQR